MEPTRPLTNTIDTMLLEERRYAPDPEFARQANAQPEIYERDWEEFWDTEGRNRVTWFEPFSKLYEWEPPYAKWYLGGKLNVCFNCVDRHVEVGNGDRVAYFWEGEPQDERREITFADLQREVVRFANALKRLGVGKGTPVAIYMGMVPELPIAMLACARLGAPHTVVFGGFSSEALSDRMKDMECELLITQDEGWRAGKQVPLKQNADEAVAQAPTVKRVVVLRRTGDDVPFDTSRDAWWHQLVEGESDDPEFCPCEPMDAEDLILYTAPTAIRSHMKWGPEHAQKHDLSSLRLLGSVGEPINPEAWVWYREHIGGDRTPIVDTWWQTETGMILITPLPGVTTTKPGSATKPFPGVDAAVFSESGEEVGPGGGGYLVLKRPWPAMLRGIYKDEQRFRDTYWSKYDDVYFAGDGARIDEDGDFWLLGRVDDVMNVSGHRISTIEVESALVDHKQVAEAAVCGRKDERTGQAIVAYVTLKGGEEGSIEMLEELRNHVAKKIGPIAKPANIVFTPELPKTRSGKIMRRLLRDVAEKRTLGDTTTLADPTIVERTSPLVQLVPAQAAVARLIALATRGTALPVRAMRAKSRVDTLFESWSITHAQ